MIHYKLSSSRGGHRFYINQKVSVSPGRGYTLYLPVWIPGSYMRRDFARLLRDLECCVDGERVEWEFINPSTWSVQIPEQGTELEISYSVYAHDLSVRGNYIDHERGFFNPCAGCIAVEGLENQAHHLQVELDESRHNWQIACAGLNADNTLQCDSYDHLIDTPIMFAEKMLTLDGEVFGHRHFIHITGINKDYADYDMTKLAHDVFSICQAQRQAFGGYPANFKDYHFHLFLGQNIYGGLEHRSSTMLMASRRGLPIQGQATPSGYPELLGLFSHEYFHAWNIKDMKPTPFLAYQLRAEQPTEMLWFFEGFTAYFDNWFLQKSGVLSASAYYELLATDLERYYQRLGRKHQCLCASSYEAWTKLYNGGEDAKWSATSYYLQGSLFALCLDLALTTKTQGQVGLIQVMRKLWREFCENHQGIDEGKVLKAVQSFVGKDEQSWFADFFARYLHGTEDLPVAELLAKVNISQQLDYLKYQGQELRVEPGFRWQLSQGVAKITEVNENSHAATAGVGVGDDIIAVNNQQISPDVITDCLCQNVREDGKVVLHAFRQKVLYRFEFALQPALKHKVTLLDKEANENCVQWLDGGQNL